MNTCYVLPSKINSTLFLMILLLMFSVTGFSQSWQQIGFDIDGEVMINYSGSHVSISGDGMTVAAGAPFNNGNGFNSGQVAVYKLVSGQWAQQGNDIDGEASEDRSGIVSLSEDGLTIAIGAQNNGGNGVNSGNVRVFKFISGVWIQQGADIDGEVGTRLSRVSLSADGLTVATGAPYYLGSGHTKVFKFIAEEWVQQGSDIIGEAGGDFSGNEISLSGDGLNLAIGALFNDGNGEDAGHVRVFKLVSNEWVQQGEDIDGEAEGDRSGGAVSLSDDGLTVAIGAGGNDGNGIDAGHTRVYKLISGSWIQLGMDIDGENAGDCGNAFNSVSLSADGLILAIGALYNSQKGSSAGHTRIYKLMSDSWVQLGLDIDGERAGDRSGNAVSLSSDGKTVAIGAPNNFGNGDYAGHTRVFSFGGGVDIEENEFENNLLVYPIPSDGNFEIDLGKIYNDITVTLASITGQIVSISKYNSAKTIQLTIDGSKGTYFAKIQSGNQQKRVKLIKN